MFSKVANHVLFLSLIVFLANLGKGETTKPRVIVIGGGPAGYFSAIQCATVLKTAKIASEVIIFESGTRSLSKVLASGGGRCNVMHDPFKGVSEIVKNYARGMKELHSPFSSKFGPYETLKWFTEKGLILKVEEDGRMFPTSDKSSSVVDLLKKEAEKHQIKIIHEAKVTSIQRLDNKFQSQSRQFQIFFTKHSSPMTISDTLDDGSVLCDRVVLATGSSRTGFLLAQSLGHSISTPIPSLFSFRIKDRELCNLSGISVNYGKVTLSVPSSINIRALAGSLSNTEFQRSLTQRGPILISRHGLTGPAILRLSSFGAKLLASTEYNCTLFVSWVGDLPLSNVYDILLQEQKQFKLRSIGKSFPAICEETLMSLTADNLAYHDRYNMRIYDSENIEEGNVDIFNPVAASDDSNNTKKFVVIRKRLWHYVLKKVNVSPETRWCDVSASSLKDIAKELCHSTYQISGRGMYKDEFVTCGGVSLKEVSLDKMESKIVDGFYLAGEVLDVDGVTGGYNFQAAWSTGYIAGDSCGAGIVSRLRESRP